jgi:ribosomal protein S18 acetylase RimI-like enzyme
MYPRVILGPVSEPISISRGGPERIDDLERLYDALRSHHETIAPSLAGAPARGAVDSWERRRANYVRWLGQPDAFALLAARADELVGFAVVSVEPGFDSWDSGERVGEVHDIAVLPSARGAGLGGRLLARTREELAAAGCRFYRLNVLAGNDDAVRFYEREGLATVTTQMMGPTAP